MAVDEKSTAPTAETIETGRFRRTWESISIIFASKTGMVGLAVVLFWVFVAIFAPLLTPYTPLEQDWKAPNQGPSRGHILGTDELGRDLWSRLIHGARVVLIILPISENLSLPGGTAIWGVFAALIFGKCRSKMGLNVTPHGDVDRYHYQQKQPRKDAACEQSPDRFSGNERI